MDARIIDKIVEVEGRTFTIRKYDVFTSIKISKMFIAKILPVFQSFIPVLSTFLKAGKNSGASAEDAAIANKILDNIEEYLSMDGIAKALDLVSEQDLDFIMHRSLMSCHEHLAAGQVPVMTSSKTYAVPDLEYNPLLGLRLVCEAVMWGLSDFFTAGRLTSIMSPLSGSLPLNQQT